jgi:hypothetical protein
MLGTQTRLHQATKNTNPVSTSHHTRAILFDRESQRNDSAPLDFRQCGAAARVPTEAFRDPPPVKRPLVTA